MPAAANIVISDGAATPVAHTFSPIGQDSKGVWWYEQINPVPTNALGAKRLGIKVVRVMERNRLTGNAKVTITVQNPTLETLGTKDSGLTPPPTVAYVNHARVEFDYPERGSLQERKDTRAFVAALTSATGPILSVIENLNPVY